MTNRAPGDNMTYFIYELYADNTDPFYIGYSKLGAKRLKEHILEAKKYRRKNKPSGLNAKKCEKILAILDAGKDLKQRILFESESYEEIQKKEKELIASKKEMLTNKFPGGTGGRKVIVKTELEKLQDEMNNLWGKLAYEYIKRATR